jgi:hypothetical protein
MCNVGAFMQEYLFGTWMSSAAGLQFQNTPQAADGLLSLIIVCNPAGKNWERAFCKGRSTSTGLNHCHLYLSAVAAPTSRIH